MGKRSENWTNCIHGNVNLVFEVMIRCCTVVSEGQDRHLVRHSRCFQRLPNICNNVAVLKVFWFSAIVSIWPAVLSAVPLLAQGRPFQKKNLQDWTCVWTFLSKQWATSFVIRQVKSKTYCWKGLLSVSGIPSIFRKCFHLVNIVCDCIFNSLTELRLSHDVPVESVQLGAGLVSQKMSATLLCEWSLSTRSSFNNSQQASTTIEIGRSVADRINSEYAED